MTQYRRRVFVRARGELAGTLGLNGGRGLDECVGGVAWWETRMNKTFASAMNHLRRGGGDEPASNTGSPQVNTLAYRRICARGGKCRRRLSLGVNRSLVRSGRKERGRLPSCLADSKS